MGNCVSFEEAPEAKCEQCSATTQTNPNLMKKGSWITKDGKRYCRPCFIKEKMEEEKYAKERAHYARAKTVLYPKTEMKKRLKRINSQEPWAQGESFYQGWRPPSTLAHLVQAITRKGTGFVGDSAADISTPQNTDANNNKTPLTSTDEETAAGSQDQVCHRSKLEALEEELDFVEEEDISHHGGGVFHHNHSSGGVDGDNAINEDDESRKMRRSSSRENDDPSGSNGGGGGDDALSVKRNSLKSHPTFQKNQSVAL